MGFSDGRFYVNKMSQTRMNTGSWMQRSREKVTVAWQLHLYLCCHAVLVLKICHCHLFVDILASQDGFEGLIDELIKRHSAGSWNNSFNGCLARMGELNEQIHD